MPPLRIGTLGAARITPTALIRPARAVEGVEVYAVAARDPARAAAFARKHGIPRAHASYDDLLADPDVEAIYNPLPNSLHHPWTIRALEAGKHVLCEKPFASNAAEAREMGAAARAADRVLMEAFHWRYHPLADRALEIIASGELGAIQHIEAWLCVPLILPGDIRYRWDLAGGAQMDVGAYTTHILRTFAGAGSPPPEVVRAEARLSSPGVDRWMRADFRFPDGRAGRTTCSLFSASLLKAAARVVGDAGRMDVLNPIAPQLYHRLTVRAAAGRRAEKVPGEATYTCQLRAFVAAVREGAPVLTGPDDAAANMALIDAIYAAAGLPARGT